MNKSRINRALDHIDELISLCERESRADARVQTARESLIYLIHVIGQFMYFEKHIKEVYSSMDSVNMALARSERELDGEPKHIPLSLR